MTRRNDSKVHLSATLTDERDHAIGGQFRVDNSSTGFYVDRATSRRQVAKYSQICNPRGASFDSPCPKFRPNVTGGGGSTYRHTLGFHDVDSFSWTRIVVVYDPDSMHTSLFHLGCAVLLAASVAYSEIPRLASFDIIWH